MATAPEYEILNKTNWNERASMHVKSPGYSYQKFLDDPAFISDVVRFDEPLLGDIADQHVVHLQCHIGTDTLSLARRGAARVVGLDFSSASLAEARRLAAQAAGGAKLAFVEASVYDAPAALAAEGAGSFDLVFTGIGALCWLPDIRRWAVAVVALLRPGGRLFLREDHPMSMTIADHDDDDDAAGRLVVENPYFETEAPLVCKSDVTYVPMGDGDALAADTTHQWNHSLGEIVQALLDAGARITGLKEHRSVPWPAIDGRMREVGGGEWELIDGQHRLPLSYTLQAVKV